jgi:hypothetical protein
MKNEMQNVLNQIASNLLVQAVRLVQDFGSFIVVETAEGRCFSADVTKTGQLKKNSIRVWTA